MDENAIDRAYNFDFETGVSPIIKVIGVGGGGGNAVTHMYSEGIDQVSFVLCNTDNQALIKSNVPRKIQLGQNITEGLGAGNKPEIARLAAEESISEITSLFNDNTKMVFITAGMGGGTGTGAAPVIARVAKEMNVLTVGIVTIPFLFEGEPKIYQALKGVDEMSQYVDALLVINNERLREIYPDLNFINAFGKADDTLTIAARSIAEIITTEGYINLDFADVNNTLKDGGVAIMSTGYGSGVGRVTQAIEDALHSPLLRNNNVFSAKKVLFNIYFSHESELKMDEMSEVNKFMLEFTGKVEVIWGAAYDESLGETVKFTILATGFNVNSVTTNEQQDFLANNKTRQENTNTPPALSLDEVYGHDLVQTMAREKARAMYEILSIAEMEDDNLLEQIDKSPAYNRDSQFKQRISTDANSATPASNSQQNPAPSKNDGTIRFF